MSAPRTIYLVPTRTVARQVLPTTHTRTVIPVSRVAHTIAPQPAPVLKRPAPVPVVDPIEELLNDSVGGGPPRKRERLNHLTAEEKLNRRKMKNRVAAQTARDRKKARSLRLEDAVRQLLNENETLRAENAQLRAEREKAFESAAFISGPLPRVQASLIAPLLLALLSCTKMSSIESSPISKKTSTWTSSRLSCHVTKKNSSKLPRALRMRRRQTSSRRVVRSHRWDNKVS